MSIPDKYTRISMDITSNCNLRCPYCLNDFSNIGENVFMSREVFGKALSLMPLVREQGTFRVSCNFEPTIHPQFIELLKMIPAGQGQKLYFTTNLAAPLSDDFLVQLSHVNLSFINISLDSLVPETFEMMRKGAKYERFLGNLERLVAIFQREPSAPRLRYITVLCKRNLAEIEALIAVTSQKYLAIEHEFRAFWHRHGQNSNWVNENQVRWSDLVEVHARLRAQPYPHLFVPFEEPENLLDLSLMDPRDQAVFASPTPLALNIYSDGKVELDRAAVRVEFSLAKIDEPLVHFRNLLALQALDWERARELRRLRQEAQLMGLFYSAAVGAAGRITRKPSSTPFCIEAINEKAVGADSRVTIDGACDSLTIRGWAIDGNAEDVAGGVIVLIDDQPFVAQYGLWRDDVALALNGAQYRACGFVVNVPAAKIGSGVHTVSAKIVSTDRTGYYPAEHTAEICLDSWEAGTPNARM
jgi:pyruvate-formate lyase-activating enzyme